ncbi:MAG: ATP-binding cassette domain-containing protein [Lacunisphaera sp.]
MRCAGPGQAIGHLSGGNQQKIALGRLLRNGADLLLLDEPTRGVDIGAKQNIYRLIDELATAGKAVLMVSSYLPRTPRHLRSHRGDVPRGAGIGAAGAGVG